MRHPVIISSMEEDFRAIGLLPQLSEADDPSKPRDVPSPDPDTLAGLDDSEGESAAHSASAKQPKPKMGPKADDSAAMDPDEDGGSAGAHKKGAGTALKVQGSKEASLRAESAQYMKAKKQVGLTGKGKNKGEKPMLARGRKPVKKLAGMKESRFQTASNLIEEVQGLINSVQVDEEMDQLLRGFSLVSENAALLADRFLEISDQYKVESIVAAMEELSADAADALSTIEKGLSGGSDEEAAVRNSSDVSEDTDDDTDRDAEETYDVPSPAFKEQTESLLQVMVGKLMDMVEAYDQTMGHMETEAAGDDDADDCHEIHVHSKAKNLHIHHHPGDDDDDSDNKDDDSDDAESDGDHDDESAHMAGAEDDAGEEDDQDSDDQGGESDHDADDQGDDSDADSDHDSNSLMARMKALRTRREAMGGGRPFRGGK